MADISLDVEEPIGRYENVCGIVSSAQQSLDDDKINGEGLCADLPMTYKPSTIGNRASYNTPGDGDSPARQNNALDQYSTEGHCSQEPASTQAYSETMDDSIFDQMGFSTQKFITIFNEAKTEAQPRSEMSQIRTDFTFASGKGAAYVDKQSNLIGEAWLSDQTGDDMVSSGTQMLRKSVPNYLSRQRSLVLGDSEQIVTAIRQNKKKECRNDNLHEVPILRRNEDVSERQAVDKPCYADTRLNEPSNCDENMPLLGGFTTGRGKPLANVSDEALKRAAKIMDIGGPEKREDKNERMFVGFKTGSGKKLAPVSKEAHDKSIHIFSDLNNTVPEKRELKLSNKLNHLAIRKEAMGLVTPHGSSEQKQSSKTANSKPVRNTIRVVPTSAPVTPRIQMNDVGASKNGRFKTPWTSATLKFGSKSLQTTHLVHKSTSSAFNTPFRTPIMNTPIPCRRLDFSALPETPKTISKPLEQPKYVKRTMSRRPMSFLKEIYGCDLWPSYQDLLTVLPEHHHDIIHINSTNAASFTFGSKGVPYCFSEMAETLKRDKDLISLKWTENHYRWIVWKLASTICRYPVLLEKLWNIETVIDQLMHRYETEINQAQRSCLKLITERDNLPSKHMVLCVCSVSADGNVELTDGWYSIMASFDEPLKRLLADGKIGVGQKLHIQGAQLGGSTQACPPLEVANQTYLKLHVNGVKRAMWDERLGYAYTTFLTNSLKSIIPNGGSIACIDVIIMRVYPKFYTERLPCGTVVKRVEPDEMNAVREWENKFQAALHEAATELKPKSRLSESEQMKLNDQVTDLTKSKIEPRNVRKSIQVLVCDCVPEGGSADLGRNTFLTVSSDDDSYLDQFKEGKRFKVCIPHSIENHNFNRFCLDNT